MKPGDTARPSASTVRVAAPLILPISKSCRPSPQDRRGRPASPSHPRCGHYGSTGDTSSSSSLPLSEPPAAALPFGTERRLSRREGSRATACRRRTDGLATCPASRAAGRRWAATRFPATAGRLAPPQGHTDGPQQDRPDRRRQYRRHARSSHRPQGARRRRAVRRVRWRGGRQGARYHAVRTGGRVRCADDRRVRLCR